MSKKQTKQMLNCLKRAETSVVLINFSVSSVKSALVLLPFIIAAQHESGTRKTIYWSVTVDNIHVSSQCFLTAQTEQVQDKNR
jgi:hypothetical protein